MSIALMLELAQDIKLEDPEHMTRQEAADFFGYTDGSLNYNPEHINHKQYMERVSKREIYRNTYQSGDYGNLVKLLYLDGEAIAVLDYQDKYLEEVDSYWLSEAAFRKFLAFVISIYNPPQFTARRAQLFTDEHAAAWYSGKLINPTNFPVNIND